MRPRGIPPTPSARSSDSAPVGIASTRTIASSSPMRMIEPLPNWRSIWESAPFSAASRAFAAFSCSLSIKPSLLEVGNEKLRPGSDRFAPLGLPQAPAGNAERTVSADRSVIAALESALEADPASTAIRLHLSQLLLEAGDAGLALDHCKAILDADPANTAALRVAAAAAEAGGDSARADGYRRLLQGLGEDHAAGPQPPPPPPAPPSTPEQEQEQEQDEEEEQEQEDEND